MKTLAVVALLVLVFQPTVHGTEKDTLIRKQNISIESNVYMGRILKVDRYISDFLLNNDARVYDLSVGYRQLPADSSRFASAFDYPTFSLGFSVGDYSRFECSRRVAW